MSDGEPAEASQGWKSGLSFVFGLTGFMTGALGLYFAFDARMSVDELRLGVGEAAMEDNEVLSTLAEDVAALRTGVTEANKRLSAQADAHEAALNKMREIVRRLMLLENLDVENGLVDMPAGAPLDTPMSLSDVAYEHLRNEVLTSATEDQRQFLFLLETKRRGKLSTLETDLVRRLESNPDRNHLKALLEKARQLIDASN